MASSEIAGFNRELLGVAGHHHAECSGAALPRAANAGFELSAAADAGDVSSVAHIQEHQHTSKMFGLRGDHAAEFGHRISGGFGILWIALISEDVRISLDHAVRFRILFGLPINAVSGYKNDKSVFRGSMQFRPFPHRFI